MRKKLLFRKNISFSYFSNINWPLGYERFINHAAVPDIEDTGQYIHSL